MAVKVTIERVTPEVAASWLALNHANRRERPNKVNQYAADMLSGMWKLTGDTIKLGGNGTDSVLIDGQNRLKAVLRSGITIETVVVRGLDYEGVMPRVDTGAGRTLADVLRLRGEKNTAFLASAVSLTWRQNERVITSSFGAVSHGRLLSFLLDHPEIRDSAAVGQRFKDSIVPLRSSSVAAADFFARRIDVGAIESFWSKVLSGENLTHRQPAYMLRKWAFNAARASRKPSWLVFAAVTNKAVIAELEGREIGVLKYSAGQDFPYVQDASVVVAE